MFAALLASAILGHVGLIAAQNPATLGLLGTGDLTTSDQGGPYNIPDVQAATVQGNARLRRCFPLPSCARSTLTSTPAFPMFLCKSWSLDKRTEM